MSSEERERASRVFEATITNTGERYACADKDTLLRGMEQLGRKCIPVGCRGGGCGVCKIRILSGRYRALKMSCEHVSADERNPGFFNVTTGKRRFYMHPVESRTGAVRMEDGVRQAVFLQLGNKSMLMDQKAGQRVADDCKSPEQTAFAEQMKDHPQPGLLDDAPKK